LSHLRLDIDLANILYKQKDSSHVSCPPCSLMVRMFSEQGIHFSCFLFPHLCLQDIANALNLFQTRKKALPEDGEAVQERLGIYKGKNCLMHKVPVMKVLSVHQKRMNKTKRKMMNTSHLFTHLGHLPQS